ncbi:hypothetical protein GC089_12920 [Cellulomonas sp. JZ18]|uniref:hypothetical protein n=1 Tax=Cellulomonas sp. JZ18 TaxID=2654191 RepID=UPI0012D4290D|nr:hypothetical protein [Cellulomonas sp. JZ18]QGQ19952.1 hypothetical protein GC089_12920 [Cellulomonas sp. JZ18]
MRTGPGAGERPALPTELVNRAVVEYVGRGSAARPTTRPDVLARLAPVGRADELRTVVDRLLAEAEAIDVAPDESVDHSVVPAFAARIRVRHPGLDDAAVDALCWASRHRREYE